MKELLLTVIIVLAVAACDRKKSPTQQPDAGAHGAELVDAARPSAASEPVEPKAPDYEDAPGVVTRTDKNRWVIVPGNGDTPICAPANLPADVTRVDAKVRFTLYADKAASADGCRPATMLVSIREDGPDQ